MADDGQKSRKNQSIPELISRLDVYKELQAIKERVSNVNLLNLLYCHDC